MPNIKSAIKRVSVIEKKTLRNNIIKSGYRTAVKKFEEAVNNKNVEEAKKLFVEATKKIDKACSKGVIVKNTAARKKSRLAKKLNLNDIEGYEDKDFRETNLYQIRDLEMKRIDLTLEYEHQRGNFKDLSYGDLYKKYDKMNISEFVGNELERS